MALGDLNHDSLTDVVVANRTNIFIYFGSSDGHLQVTPRIISKIGMSNLVRIAIGDLTNDGKDDIAASYTDNLGNPIVSIFNQSNDFNLLVDVNIIIPNPYQVVIGHFDNSITNDIAVVCGGDRDLGFFSSVVLVKSPFFGAGTKAIIGLTNQNNPQLITAGYINSDGLQDLVVGDFNGPNVTLLVQPSPAGTLTSAWSNYGTINVGGAIVDLRMINNTGSGIRDLAIANAAYDRVEIRNNTGSTVPNAATRLVLGATGLCSMSFGRLSGSSLPDLVIISSQNNDCKIYPRQSGILDQNIYSRFPVNKAPVRTITIDSGTVMKGIYVLSAGGGGVPTALEFFQYSSNGIGNADKSIFQNGKPSGIVAGNVSVAVIASIIQDQNAVRVTDLAGTIATTLTTQNGPCGLFIGDLDRDGIGDLAVINRLSSSISIYRGGPDFMTRTAPDFNIDLHTGEPWSITGGWVQDIDQTVLVIGCRNGVEIIYDAFSNPVHEVLGLASPGDRTEVILGNFNPLGSRWRYCRIESRNGSSRGFLQER